MSEFINTIDLLGDEVVLRQIIDKTISEFKDNSLKTIGAYAFYQCKSLKEVDVPSATYSDVYSFAECSSLESVNLPLITRVSEDAFRKCSSLKDVTLSNATELQQRAFHSCSSLEKLIVPKAITFYNNSLRLCTALKVVDTSKLNKINEYVFTSNTNMTCLILRNTERICNLGALNSYTDTPIANGTGFIYVPSVLFDGYKNQYASSIFANQFRALEDYTVDGTITGELDPNKI